MNKDSKLNLADRLRSARRIHQFSRLVKLPVALQATRCLRAMSPRAQLAALSNRQSAIGPDANPSPSHTPGPEDSKRDHGKSSSDSSPRPTLGWLGRLEKAVIAINELAHRASARTEDTVALNQTLDPRYRAREGETREQSSSPTLTALVSFSSRLIDSQTSGVRLAVIPAARTSSRRPGANDSDAVRATTVRSGLEALLTKVCENEWRLFRAVSQHSGLGAQNSSARGIIVSPRSSAAGRERQASRLTAAIAKTISSGAARSLETEDVQLRLLTLRRAAAIVTFAAPLLAAPALAAIPATRRAPGDASCPPSIVINSTPTVVVNSSQSSDVERQVLEALRQHRDALYEQWSSEVQRRQRTEF